MQRANRFCLQNGSVSHILYGHITYVILLFFNITFYMRISVTSYNSGLNFAFKVPRFKASCVKVCVHFFLLPEPATNLAINLVYSKFILTSIFTSGFGFISRSDCILDNSIACFVKPFRCSRHTITQGRVMPSGR